MKTLVFIIFAFSSSLLFAEAIISDPILTGIYQGDFSNVTFSECAADQNKKSCDVKSLHVDFGNKNLKVFTKDKSGSQKLIFEQTDDTTSCPAGYYEICLRNSKDRVNQVLVLGRLGPDLFVRLVTDSWSPKGDHSSWTGVFIANK